MKERIEALKVKLNGLFERLDKLEIYNPSYELINKIKELEMKIDQMNDLILWIEADQEF